MQVFVWPDLADTFSTTCERICVALPDRVYASVYPASYSSDFLSAAAHFEVHGAGQINQFLRGCSWVEAKLTYFHWCGLPFRPRMSFVYCGCGLPLLITSRKKLRNIGPLPVPPGARNWPKPPPTRHPGASKSIPSGELCERSPHGAAGQSSAGD